jgi:hypothetical protein
MILTTSLLVCAPEPAAGQQSISDVLLFLMTNRSIATDDFVRDEQAATQTSDTVATFLEHEVATLPIASTASGFAYRLDPALGTMTRSTDSFGPSFTEWSLTSGAMHTSFGISYRNTAFDTIDGQNLRDGTLVSTASLLRGETQPFDIETVSLRIRLNSVIVSGNLGVTDRLDLSAALPFVTLSLNGERVDTYRGRRLVQASASATASGPGDLALRGKYNVVRSGASGFAVGGEARFPTGDEDNLLGAGELSLKARLLGSFEAGRVGVHGEAGFGIRGPVEGLDYAGAVTVVAVPRLTLVGEFYGRRLDDFGQLTQTTVPHPRLAGVDTIRLTGVPQTTNRLVAVGGVKWNVDGGWIVSANVLWPVTESGLNAQWTPIVAFDYSFAP